ncbi:hypothetical protein OEA41_000610 [Lepraria neglecta]|uniref:Uncharacterized protein n=1 Tax=Lepraria neglecta TaxID=209136 RepID=A0AAD9ZGK0_9LECA|nr:hypothetical protein OEA41_000610 [Lepraria neglecta]
MNSQTLHSSSDLPFPIHLTAREKDPELLYNCGLDPKATSADAGKLDDQSFPVLDPRHLESDLTITIYHQRVVAILSQDRAKISVALPAHPKIDQLRKEFEEMKNGMRELALRTKATEQRIEREDRLRFIAFKANLTENFVEKLSKEQKISMKKGKNDPEANKIRLMDTTNKILKKLSAQNFKAKTGLEPSFRASLSRYGTIVDQRRACAHGTENEFARLLLSDQFKRKNQELNVDHWAKMLLWVYEKKTLEEMANVVANV